MSPGPIQSTAEPFLRAFRADLARYFAFAPDMGVWKKLEIALTTDGVWAVGVYRLGRALRRRRRGAAGRLAWAGYRSLEVLVRVASGIRLDVESRIAPGLYIGHFGSIHVGAGAAIGAHSSIGQMCFIGAGGPEAPPGAPTLGERVYLGVGAKVLGGVRVGDGVAVGANSVVLSDVPPKAVVAGNPARVVSFRGSEDFLGSRAPQNRLRATPPLFGPAEGPTPPATAPTTGQDRKGVEQLELPPPAR